MKARNILGVALIVAGIVIGVYVGVWVCFIGGIVDIVEQIRAESLETVSLAWGVAKILFAGFFGLVSGGVVSFCGYLLWN